MTLPTLQLQVLTTPNATERHNIVRATVAASGGLRGVDWNFFHSISHEAAGLGYDDGEAYKARGRTLSKAELSCYAGHYQIARNFIEAGTADYLLVCEDDVYIDPWFDMRAAAQLMQAAKIDYLRLYARAFTPAKLILYWARYQIIRFNWTPGGTQAYLLSRKGAKRLVDHLNNEVLIRRPIDDEMDRFWRTGNAVYALHPWPVLEYNASSTVHGADQIAARLAAQKQLIAQLPREGLLQKLKNRVASLREKLARARAERSLRQTDTEVAAAASAFLENGKTSGFHATPSIAPTAADRPLPA
ncbi:MAG: glycosyltransferase family 25 protein [Hyphomonadaceae bacterium]|nr:glycosyltransferase family 25 protein [Hyphomonadaceae bacterium]